MNQLIVQGMLILRQNRINMLVWIGTSIYVIILLTNEQQQQSMYIFQLCVLLICTKFICQRAIIGAIRLDYRFKKILALQMTQYFIIVDCTPIYKIFFGIDLMNCFLQQFLKIEMCINIDAVFRFFQYYQYFLCFYYLIKLINKIKKKLICRMLFLGNSLVLPNIFYVFKQSYISYYLCCAQNSAKQYGYLIIFYNCIWQYILYFLFLI
eukprot:TRINITY_DN25619_c0_g1_i3.p3 TRINITY_DN25619_c0_g1~~TRINITY_DN25619_c0_g1_i3.p3  ORF type:complete len:209 (+),score=-6.97 TRINITY_DN25619_c0_g1_i3:913-1539(+)